MHMHMGTCGVICRPYGFVVAGRRGSMGIQCLIWPAQLGETSEFVRLLHRGSHRKLAVRSRVRGKSLVTQGFGDTARRSGVRAVSLRLWRIQAVSAVRWGQGRVAAPPSTAKAQATSVPLVSAVFGA
jgi:hypothetical protein